MAVEAASGELESGHGKNGGLAGRQIGLSGKLQVKGRGSGGGEDSGDFAVRSGEAGEGLNRGEAGDSGVMGVDNAELVDLAVGANGLVHVEQRAPPGVGARGGSRAGAASRAAGAAASRATAGAWRRHRAQQ